AGSARRRTHVSRDGAGLPPGARGVHDEPQAAQLRGRKAGDSMKPAAVTIALALALSGCGGGATPAPASTANSEAGTPSGGPPGATYFTVPPEQMSHLQLATVSKATWSTTLHTTGTVDWDQDHTTQAITQVSGPITRIVVDTGARVKKGDPLLYVSS